MTAHDLGLLIAKTAALAPGIEQASSNSLKSLNNLMGTRHRWGKKLQQHLSTPTNPETSSNAPSRNPSA